MNIILVLCITVILCSAIAKTQRSLSTLPTDLLISAVKHDKLEEVKKLLLNVNPNIKDELGNSPLIVGIQEGHTDIVEVLLVYKADPNIRDDDDNPAINLAAVKMDNDKIIELLIKHKADLNSKDENGQTPLHYAAKSDECWENVRVLIENGADVNAVDNKHQTPLYFAVQNFLSTPIVEFLLRSGANVNVSNNNGENVLAQAVLHGNKGAVDVLLSYKVDVNQRAKGLTPLHLAAAKGFGQIAGVLLKNGAHVNAVEPYNYSTPLHFAVPHGNASEHYQTVELLINAGANVNARNKNNEMPLDIAYGDQTISLLVKHKARKNVT